MIPILIAILIVAALSLAINALYISHELGFYPHIKDRTLPADRKLPFHSRYEKDVLATHSFQVMDPNTHILREFGHASIYTFDDPYQALENAIKRYKEQSTRSRYDDLIHLSNHICNHVKCDERINLLIGEIHELIHKTPLEQNKDG